MAKAFLPNMQMQQPTVQIFDKKPEETRVIKRLQSKLLALDDAPPAQRLKSERDEIGDAAEPAATLENSGEKLAATEQVAKALAAKSDARKAADDDDKKKPKAQPKAKANPKAKGKKEKPKEQPKAKAKGKKEQPKTKAKDQDKTPSWCYERSRDQILCRTGLPGPGQSKTIRGVGPKSVKEAYKWLQQLLAK